jgi:hypothetical protein
LKNYGVNSEQDDRTKFSRTKTGKMERVQGNTFENSKGEIKYFIKLGTWYTTSAPTRTTNPLNEMNEKKLSPKKLIWSDTWRPMTTKVKATRLLKTLPMF